VELTIPGAVARAAREFGDAEAVADPLAGPGGPRLSYRELDERVTAVTGALIDAGIGPGDRVALWAPNDVYWVLIALGALSLIRSSRLLGFVAAGAYLYDAAQKVDADRRRRGVDLPSRRRESQRVDDEIADSFPASDPPSFSGTTAGTP